MDIKNILILSMVKGIGPAFIKKNCHRLINDSSCDQIVKESKPEELDNLVDKGILEFDPRLTGFTVSDPSKGTT